MEEINYKSCHTVSIHALLLMGELPLQLQIVFFTRQITNSFYQKYHPDKINWILPIRLTTLSLITLANNLNWGCTSLTLGTLPYFPPLATEQRHTF